MSECSLPLYSTKLDINKSEVTIIEQQDNNNNNHRPQSWPVYTVTEKLEKEEIEKQEHHHQQHQQKIKSYHYSYCHPTSTTANNNKNNNNKNVTVSMLFQDSWTLSSLSEEDDDEFMNYEFDDIHFNDDDDYKEKDLSAYVFPLPPDNNHELIDSKMFFPRFIYNNDNNNDLIKKKESIIKLPLTSTYSTNTATINTNPFIKPIPTFHIQSILFLFGFLFCPCWWLGWYLGTKNKFNKNQIYQYPPLYENHIHIWSSTSYYNEIQCYSKFNRILSIVSFFLILIIIALLVWYYIGIGKKWW